jgi:putative DNA primase/helicase
MIGIYTIKEGEGAQFKCMVSGVDLLFERYQEVIDSVGEDTNLYYTVAKLKKGAPVGERSLGSQQIIPFDIDGCNRAMQQDYIDAFLKAVDVDYMKTGVVWSGHGLHFLVETNEPIITDPKQFSKFKPAYKAVCEKIQKNMEILNLPGEVDSSVWSPGRLLRVPGTINKKKGKGSVKCFAIQSIIKPQEFKFDSVDSKLVMPKGSIAISDTIDKSAVLSGCEFLKWAKEKPNEMSYEQWFAMCAVTARMDDSGDLSHTMSKGYTGYDPEEVDRQLAYIETERSNISCDYIENCWDKCQSCPNYGKVRHPTDIKREEFIATRSTGFRKLKKNGSLGAPDYEDMAKYFATMYTFVSVPTLKVLYAYKDGVWEIVPEQEIKGVGYDILGPDSTDAERRAFYDHLMCKNRVTTDYFHGKCQGKVNFKNGVLDLATGEFCDHHPDFGFRWKLHFDYDKDATAPFYEKLIDDITEGDSKTKQLLEEIGGYVVSGCPPSEFQRFFLLHGEGANGKTTFAYAVMECIGKDTIRSKAPSELGTETGRSALVGMLLNFCDETPKNLFKSDIMKQLATGSPVDYRFLYSKTETEELIAKHIFACNEIPRNSDSTYGLMRKTIIVPFTKTIAKKDQLSLKEVKDGFKEEAAGLFNLFYGGYLRLMKNKDFTLPQKCHDALDAFKVSSDSALEWSTECLEADEDGAVPVSAAYMHYRDWCHENGVRAKGKRSFGNSMTRIAGKSKPVKRNGVLSRCYKGFVLIDPLTGDREDELGSHF